MRRTQAQILEALLQSRMWQLIGMSYGVSWWKLITVIEFCFATTTNSGSRFNRGGRRAARWGRRRQERRPRWRRTQEGRQTGESRTTEGAARPPAAIRQTPTWWSTDELFAIWIQAAFTQRLRSLRWLLTSTTMLCIMPSDSAPLYISLQNFLHPEDRKVA